MFARYNKCIYTLEFHHKNPNEKEFKLGSGNTMSWKEYKQEVLKCILVCANCHKEIHSKLGYIYLEKTLRSSVVNKNGVRLYSSKTVEIKK